MAEIEIEDPPKIGLERGTAADEYTPLFDSYFGTNGGTVFDINKASPADFDEMLDRDGKAQGLENVLTLPIRQAQVLIKPAKGDKGEAEWLEDALLRPANAGGMTIPLSQIIAQACQARTYRRVYFEKVFGTRDGKFVYDKIAWRPPSTCKPKYDTQNGAFRGFVQDPIGPSNSATMGKPIHIEPRYAFMHVNGKRRDPLRGISDLEVTYWCYQTRQKIRFLWYQFLEGQALPKTIVKGDDQGGANDTARRVATLKSGGVVGITKQYDIAVHESSGTGAGQFIEAMKWLESEASGSVLAGFTDLAGAAASGTGSYALSKDQSDFFLQAQQASAQEVADSISNYLIADLIRWNFGKDAAVPLFQFGPLSEYDSEKVIDLCSKFLTSNAPKIPEEFTEELAVKTAGYLDLDVDKVLSGMQRAAKEAKEKAEKEAATAEQAAKAGPIAAVRAPVAMAAKAVQAVKKPA